MSILPGGNTTALSRFRWSVYLYSSGLLHWHWGDRIVDQVFWCTDHATHKALYAFSKIQGCNILVNHLQWRNNACNGVSNHWRLDRLLNHCSGADQRKHQSSASLAFGGNSPVTGEYPVQMASNTENVSNWLRRHDIADDSHDIHFTVLYCPRLYSYLKSGSFTGSPSLDFPYVYQYIMSLVTVWSS